MAVPAGLVPFRCRFAPDRFDRGGARAHGRASDRRGRGQSGADRPVLAFRLLRPRRPRRPAVRGSRTGRAGQERDVLRSGPRRGPDRHPAATPTCSLRSRGASRKGSGRTGATFPPRCPTWHSMAPAAGGFARSMATSMLSMRPGGVRGRRREPGTALARGRARRDRPLQERGAARGVPGIPAQPESARREDRRPVWRRGFRAVDRRCGAPAGGGGRHAGRQAQGGRFARRARDSTAAVRASRRRAAACRHAPH